jgi:hypothetical protein
MTTVVYRDGVLASDTAVFDRGCYCGEATKITRGPDGTIGGCAGALAVLSRFLGWIESGCEGEPPSIPENEDSECLWVTPDGLVWWLGPNSRPTTLQGKYFAIGSGFRIAVGALAMDATAIRAVEVCADLDSSTRRPIQTLTLGAEMVRAAE